MLQLTENKQRRPVLIATKRDMRFCARRAQFCSAGARTEPAERVLPALLNLSLPLFFALSKDLLYSSDMTNVAFRDRDLAQRVAGLEGVDFEVGYVLRGVAQGFRAAF